MAGVAIAAFSFLVMKPCVAQSASVREPLEAVSVEAALANASSSLQSLGWIDRATLIASTRETADRPADLMRIDIRTGKSRVIAQGRHPSVSPDRHWVAFLQGDRWKLLSLADGKLIDLDLSQIAKAVVFQPPAWSRDGRHLAIIEDARGKPEAESANSVSTTDGTAVGPNIENLGDLADRSAQEYWARITILSVATPTERRSISLSSAVYYGAWGKAGSFYYTEMQMRSPTFTRIQELNIADGGTRTVWNQPDGIMQTARPVVSPDGRSIAFIADVDFRRWSDYESVVLADIATGKERRLSRSIYATRDLAWSSDGKALYANARCGGFTKLYKLSLDGTLAPLTGCERRGFDVALLERGSQISYQTEDGYGRRDIRVLDADTKSERVIQILAEPAARFRMGRFEQVRFPTKDGLQLYGFLIYPPGFDPAKKYPLYADVHGGGSGSPLSLMGPLTGLSNGQYGPLEWHAWAALGYLVFVPDYRSSGEYGPDIARARYVSGDFGGVMRDALDVDEGVQWLLARGFVDPQRVAVLGHSAGGARVNYLLTRSHLYRAGILSDPIGSGALAYLLEHTAGRNTGERFESFRGWGFGEETQGKAFRDAPAGYLSGFLFDGYKSTTPTLIFTGNEAKGAMHPISAEVLFSMLRQYGIPTRMLRYTNDGHNPTDAASAISRFSEVRKWLEAYIPAHSDEGPRRP